MFRRDRLGELGLWIGGQRGLGVGSSPARAGLTGREPYYNQQVLQPYGYRMTVSQHLDATFMALADPTRRAILARLAQGEASVAELAAPFRISQPAISQHLKVLERAGLVSSGQEAQRRPRRIEARPLAEANAWLERYREVWEANFQRLDALLEELQRKPAKPLHRKKRRRTT